MNSRAVKIAVSLLLTVSLLCCSVSVFAVDPTPTPSVPPIEGTITEIYKPAEVLWHESGCYMVWALLRSWGVNITVGEVIEWSDEVEEQLTELVYEYLDTLPSVGSIFVWTRPWLWQTDFWGNVRYNSTMLEDIEDFANWLQEEFGLTDNSEVEVADTHRIGNVTLYELGKYYKASKYEGTNVDSAYMSIGDQRYFQNSVVAPTYYFYTVDHIDGVDKVAVSFISTQSLSVTVLGRYYTPDYSDEDNLENAYNLSVTLPNQEGIWYYSNSRHTGFAGRVRPVGVQFLQTNASTATQYKNAIKAMLGGQLITDPGYGIVTDVILYPSDDPSYTPGDSVTLVDGSPIYIEIEWPESISVDNLPAVISPTTITDPDLEGVYGEVKPFIRTFSGGMDMMRSIIMQLPEEAIACLFALMGAIIIFGFIKIMREH